MLPLGDVVPRRTFPHVTVAVVVGLLSGLGWYRLMLPPERQLEWLWRIGAIRGTVPWPALVTACWIDPSWLAGLANAIVLALFGPAVEDRFGHLRYGAFLTTAELLGTSASVSLAQVLSAPAAGALAPVSAVIATYLALFPHSKLSFWAPTPSGGALRECQAFWAVLVWVLLVPGGLLRQLHGMAPSSQVLTALAVGGLAAVSARVVARRERMLVTWWDPPEQPQR